MHILNPHNSVREHQTHLLTSQKQYFILYLVPIWSNLATSIKIVCFLGSWKHVGFKTWLLKCHVNYFQYILKSTQRINTRFALCALYDTRMSLMQNDKCTISRRWFDRKMSPWCLLKWSHTCMHIFLVNLLIFMF